MSFLFYDMALRWPFAAEQSSLAGAVIAALFLLVMLRATGRSAAAVIAEAVEARWPSWGLLNNALPFFLIVNGQAQPGFHGGMSSIFNSTVPLFTVIIAQFFLADEKITDAEDDRWHSAGYVRASR